MPVNLSLLLGFLLLSAVLSAVPGPSVILETSRAISRGRRAAMWIVAGNALGGLGLLALVIAGLGAIVTASSQLFTAVRIAGALYLLWLGIQAIRAARSAEVSQDQDVRAERPAPRWAALRQGFLVGMGNPKSIVALMAILPQFVDPSIGAPVVQMVIIGLAGALAQILIETLWVCAAGSLRAWFRRRPRRIRTLQVTGGVAMIGLSGKLALDR